MTNGEKFNTAQERAKAFDKYCGVRCHEDQSCSVAGCRKCLLDWLDLEAEKENLLPCPFCGGAIDVSSGRYGHYAFCKKCAYCAPFVDTKAEAIATHNRLAKIVMESEAAK